MIAALLVGARWAALAFLAFVAIGGTVMMVAATIAACLPAATWPQTHRAALKAAGFGGAAAAVVALLRLWP